MNAQAGQSCLPNVKDFQMTEKHIVLIFGNGDTRRGKAVLTAIAQRLRHARTIHEWPEDCHNLAAAGEVVLSEVNELLHAISFETPARASEEALDVIATAVRLYNSEWER